MEITINGEKHQLVGNPPKVGDEFPHFKVFDKNNHKIKMKELLGKVTLLSVVPDINTPVCSIQTKHFNSTMDQFSDVNFLTISTNTIADQQKWCAAEGVKKMQLVADTEESFGYESKLLILDEGILARSVWILDKNGKVVYREIVSELVDEPDYDQAITALKEQLKK
ncbi:thiol peroxidase [Limosilactobacillus sp. STM2_1]|uniref:Thiol peroxidase n=1 Tax=Limosilactobacillus rudii TaxID=2759755 RepID=A0A7W3YP84_9LACO|nr:thiol peroxidase [Limosilactobacillus rudii]MBB1080464.1 thiol peroxidase [Limosilactobacillus rudii]MBB1098490.1 thiol peroxidase [Limosilactobacillus rudii]MCD7135498.1 thiol peroxidase [Limosilactobacillus rudii]